MLQHEKTKEVKVKLCCILNFNAILLLNSLILAWWFDIEINNKGYMRLLTGQDLPERYEKDPNIKKHVYADLPVLWRRRGGKNYAFCTMFWLGSGCARHSGSPLWRSGSLKQEFPGASTKHLNHECFCQNCNCCELNLGSARLLGRIEQGLQFAGQQKTSTDLIVRFPAYFRKLLQNILPKMISWSHLP